MKKKEADIINVQLITLFISLFSLILSIIITYNQKLNLEDKDEMFDTDDLFKITLFNRVLIVIISLIFLYVNYKLYEISKDEGEDLKSYNLQIVASILTVIAGLIALYVVSLSKGNDTVDVENPII